MGSIYSKARLVHIYLGETEDGDHTAEAMDLLANVPEVQDRPRFTNRVKSDPDGVRGLINLLRRPYWQRMWMFQEIVLSRKAVVHCGSYNTSWMNVRSLDTMVSGNDRWLKAQVTCDWILELRRAFFDVAPFFVSWVEACADLISILEPTRHLQCTDPRDKLFALIGVCDALSIRTDYSRPVRDVYTDFTRQLLEYHGSMFPMVPLLTAGPCNPNNGPQLDLPSWVPDYRGTHGVDIRYLAASCFGHFTASLDLYSSFTFPSRLELVGPNDHYSEGLTRSPDMLAARGVLVDTVSVTMKQQETQSSPHSLLKLADLGGLGPRPSGEEDPAQILFRTMIFDDKTLHEPGSDKLGYSSGTERYIRLALGFARFLSMESTGKPEANFLDSFTGLKSDNRTLRQHY